MFSADSASQPLVTLTIFVRVWFVSPGFILSGEKPTLKSVPHLSPEYLSSTGTQSLPRYSPDKLLIHIPHNPPFFKILPTVSDAFRTGVRSGRLYLSVGVGTAIIWKEASLKSSGLLVRIISVSFKCFGCQLIAGIDAFFHKFNPIRFDIKTNNSDFLANSSAIGRPT